MALSLPHTFGQLPKAVAPLNLPTPRSKAVCRQLGIVSYHPQVDVSQTPAEDVGATVSVPTAKVQLVQSLKLPPKPDKCVIADVSYGLNIIP